MKTNFKIILLLVFTLTVFNCDNNDDEQSNPQTPTDGFTHNGVFFPTENAYFEIDEEDDVPIVGNNGFPDNYTFFFSNGRLFDNDPANINGLTDDLLLSLNTTNFVLLSIKATDNPSLVSNAPMAGNTYIVSSLDAVIVENGQIDPLTPPYLNSGFEFGTGNENVGIFNTPGSIGPSITINALFIDNNNPSASTIDASYTFMNQNGEMITGQYQGTFGAFFG